MTGTSLRDELRGAAVSVPEFSIMLPAGWRDAEPSRATFTELAENASATFRRHHRPDLDAQVRGLIENAADALLAADPVRLYLQSDVPADSRLPISLTAVRMTAPDGGSLDAHVEQLVRSRDAAPMDAEGGILRWVADSTRTVGGDAIAVRTVNYLIAIPGTERRSGLLFSSLVLLSEGDADDALITGLVALADGIIATFEWTAR